MGASSRRESGCVISGHKICICVDLIVGGMDLRGRWPMIRERKRCSHEGVSLIPSTSTEARIVAFQGGIALNLLARG